MNSKKKNKNRQNKPPNPTPPQKQEVSEPSSPPEVINTETESVVEERVPNIVSENVAAEVKETEDTPKKPKRNRGKKKKEDEKSDKEDELRVEEPIPDKGTQLTKDTSNEATITPTARKKKNKNKKVQGLEENVEKAEIRRDTQFHEEINPSQETGDSKRDESEQDMKPGKKKNKKKKNRNDSEKSDKIEEVSCISAFQKLLEDDTKAKSIPQPSTDDSSFSETTVKEAEISPQVNTNTEDNTQETLQKEEGNKNKKKNKKDKRNTTVSAMLKVSEQMQSFDTKAVENVGIPINVHEPTSDAIIKESTDLHKDDETMASTSTADDQIPKHKSKIAKPVEKKKKGKDNEKIVEGHLDENISAVQSENVEGIKITEIEPILESSEDFDDVLIVPLTEMTPDWQEEVKIEEGNGPVVGCDDKTESITLEQPMGSKNKNKSLKTPRKTEMPASPSVSTANFEKTLLKASSGSIQQTENKSGTISEVNVEHQKDTTENVAVTTDTEERARTELDSSEISSIPILDESMLKSTIDEKKDYKPEIMPEETATSSKGINDFIQAASGNKRKNRRKSPPLPRKGETTHQLSNVPTEMVLPETTHVDETTMLVSTICPDILATKPEEPHEIIHDNLLKTQSDEIERTKTPDSDKRQKRKKSPKPIEGIHLASGSKSNEEPKKNVLKIEDIIIIQAEIVSDEKAQKGNTFVASEDVTDKKDAVQQKNIKHSSEKHKKRKKSPKPPQSPSKNLDKSCELETQGLVQIPVTPDTHDIKFSPDTLALELETPQINPTSSPSDITPDFIEYPRCSSEHLDSNNNMIIQELSHSEAKLEVPFATPDTPIIESSNVSILDLGVSLMKEKDVKSENKPLEEKTDLKSKVMEVNQDMEDLRLSIERSLAELKSLEKTDKDAEKQAEEENRKNDLKTVNIEIKPSLSIFEKANESVFIGNLEDCIQSTAEVKPCQEPVCPARKDHKGKGKSKKKGKQESTIQNLPAQTTSVAENSSQSQETKQSKDTEKSDQKSDDTHDKAKQQAAEAKGNKDDDVIGNDNNQKNNQADFEPIENFEDAMTSSVDDVNKSFEMIVNDVNPRISATLNNPEINVIAPPQEVDRDSKQDKQNPISPPKNLLGHPDIPVPSSRTDYKKEKNKPPNTRQAKVKIKDANQVQIEAPEKSKLSKESQTDTKRKATNYKRPDESICVTNQNDDYVYKYSFRKVFLQCVCHVCKKDLKQARVPCGYCNLIFYCSQKHKDEDYAQHQALCFAVSTIVHLKDQKFIYADARDVTGQNYRLLRMQMIVSCEKVLKRRLVPWEQEALLYPRMCGDSSCREWRQAKLVDCEGCGQISYCADHPEHLPKSHSRWCKSYNLYRALVKHQQTQGRLEPKLPTKVAELNPLPENINEVLASMYEEKIDMSDIEYAALTQLATAPLTALFCLQHKPNNANGITKKSTLTLHIVGAELQFEADILNKWEVFLLHLVPDVKELRVVLIGPDLNPSNLPLELLGKIKVCENCRQNKRRIVFGFQDKRTYHEFWTSDDFTSPDLVCAFNPSIQRSSTYNGKDTWPSTINCILKLKTLFAITSYTLSELTSDLLRVQECAGVGYNVVYTPKNNSFSSVRPDRNFISDDEAPLLFKNHCVAVVSGV